MTTSVGAATHAPSAHGVGAGEVHTVSPSSSAMAGFSALAPLHAASRGAGGSPSSATFIDDQAAVTG